MKLLLKYFWWIPGLVHFQRQWIMTLFSLAPPSLLEKYSDAIAQKVAAEFKSSSLNQRLETHFNPIPSEYVLLTHCPSTIAKKIQGLLGYKETYSIEVKNYFNPISKIDNFDKAAILAQLRLKYSPSETIFVADDMIDLKCLKNSDRGILVNPSCFTKFFASFFKHIEIWD